MSMIYDNWERLLAAVIKRQQLLQLFHDQSRSPSVLSDASFFSFSSDLDDEHHDLRRYESGLVFVSDFLPVFELEDLLNARYELIGKGNFGFSYTAKLVDHRETSIVVKRLNSMVYISEQDFKRNMVLVGNMIKHENVDELRAYCSYRSEKLMIYDHHMKGSVSALLHGKNGESRVISHVPWKLRLRIAIGAARGLSHIHTHNGGKMVHGNIKASNIFLNSQSYGLVSDLGLANTIPATFVRSSRYYAPEVKCTRDVSQASDVYSFGILLLELLTPFSHDAVDIVKLVTSVSRKEWSTKVFDVSLLWIPTIREQIVRMLEIGIRCVAKSPKKRPKMSAVVKVMESIFAMDMDNQIYEQTESLRSGVPKWIRSQTLVFLGDGDPTFYYEDLLLAAVESLGKGTLGTSYKATLEDGNVIFVKRLKDVIVTNLEFQQSVEGYGRVGHENITELRAYYYSKGEQLLVYDYYHEGSLSAMLHGNRDLSKKPLDWDARLNIAVGAAKGIAYIHKEHFGQKFVHGNIRSSNIFRNKEKYGIISDVGLRELVDPAIFFVTRTKGYRAPEVTDHTKLSQASDVYSFGVVMLELLSGKPSLVTCNGEAMSLVRWAKTAIREERTGEVLDPMILMHEDVKEIMVRMMQKAMYCVASDPEKRPYMTDVVKMLEETHGTETD